MTEYVIEIFNPIRNKYEEYWRGEIFKIAEIMMNKPYYKGRTRRLIKIEKEYLYTFKAEKVTNG